MAYNSYYPVGYQPYQYIPQNNYMTQQNTQMLPQSNGQPIWVQGEAGAKSYLVAPNSTVVLWDSEAQTIYVKSADASGMPSIKTLDYTMRESTPQTSNIQPQSDFATKEDISLIRKEMDALRAMFEDKKESEKK